jgi:CRISPR-associated endonuclease Cas1
MAASGTLPQPNFSRKSPIGKSGVLALFGYGIKVRMQCGHLEIEDGIGPERRKIRLARVGHGLKRLVIVSSDGFISLAALQWLADQDASFVLLEKDGSVLATTGPVRPSEAKLRRAQALAHSSGATLSISRELISRKLSAQEDVARHTLLDTSTADTIARFRAELPNVESINTIRLVEAQAARAYWAAWSTLPINFPKSQLPRIPTHWSSFGMRISPLTGSPRLACNPANAVLNYLYAVLESEARLAAATLGLDPGLGVLHADTTARDSLACDLMEPVRPHVDAYVLDWITKQFLNREWFVEQRDGNCRLVADLAARLSETGPIWRRHVEPVAEWVARAIWSTIRRPDKPFTTRLTQDNKRTAKGGSPQLSLTWVPSQQSLCAGCGKPVRPKSKHCAQCSLKHSTESLIAGAELGRKISHGELAQARRKESRRRHALARSAWSPNDLPTWLTEEVYEARILPKLKLVSLSQIASTIGVSIPYASDIRKGRRRPHPMHWAVLAKLVSIPLSQVNDLNRQ